MTLLRKTQYKKEITLEKDDDLLNTWYQYCRFKSMKGSFEIAINIMGDVDNKIARVTGFEDSSEYVVQMPGDQFTIKVEFNESGDIVQTDGIPLDSNTLYSISDGIKTNLEKSEQRHN